MNTHLSLVRSAVSAAFLALAVSVPAAPAQRPHTLARANVPFAFQYGTRSLPAGTYTFTMTSGPILEVRGSRGAALSVVSWSDETQPTARTGKLVFHREGDRYALRDLWVPELAAHLHCAPVRQHRHRELAEAQPSASSGEVEVALLESPR